ncbi:MAG: radical SAM protein [Nitrospiraceae bacterium]|nr:radical SAM protein [Nitrospiraceae bacterium]
MTCGNSEDHGTVTRTRRMQVKVCEIFTSIQGESSHVGRPCTFVRLTGCNLRCIYCDTRYSYDEGVELSVDEIISHIRLVSVNLVEITGGEPLLQEEGVRTLIRLLLDDGYEVLLETNGSRSIRDIDRRAVVILDVKTPGSLVNSEMDPSNLDILRPSDEVKFVITGREDYEWAKRLMAEKGLRDKCGVLFSPAFGMIAPHDLAKWIIEDRLDVRFNAQLHKYLFGPDKRMV